jgi:hypothetical protein
MSEVGVWSFMSVGAPRRKTLQLSLQLCAEQNEKSCCKVLARSLFWTAIRNRCEQISDAISDACARKIVKTAEQTFGPQLVEIRRHKSLGPPRNRADCRPSSLCPTFNLSIEDQATVYDRAVSLSKGANINGTELRIPRHGDDAREALISLPPCALD